MCFYNIKGNKPKLSYLVINFLYCVFLQCLHAELARLWTVVIAHNI